MAALPRSQATLLSQSAAATRTSLPHVSRRSFSYTRPRKSYDDTVHNLKIGKHTRVIYQGFTGRVATGNARDSLAYGTNIVGGVTPGKEGEHLGLPLLPDLKRAKAELKPDATAVFVAAPQCAQAIEDAIEAEIPLIVAVAEHIPLHDILRVSSILRTQSASRLVGANAPGIIAPLGFCRIGFQPLPTFAPGHIGIAAKSGTLSYEAVASITRAGLGQSLCIGMGGDIVAGTNLVDALRVFEHDDDTEAIVLIGEVGGRAEEDAAEWIADYRRRTPNPKPIAALVGGREAKIGHIMGHAGAWAARGEANAEEKYRALERAGATMVDHPEKFGGVVKTLLSQAGRDVGKIQASARGATSSQQQQRGYHTIRRGRSIQQTSRPMTIRRNAEDQRRTLFLGPDQARGPLAPYLDPIDGLVFSSEAAPAKDSYYLGVLIDRTERSPYFVAAPTADPALLDQRVKRFPYDWRTGPSDELIRSVINHLQLSSAPLAARGQATSLLHQLAKMHKEKEAIILTGSVSIPSASSALHLHIPSLTLMFDDSAYRSSKRQEDIHALRRKDREHPAAVEAEKDGIVFVSLGEPDDSGACIGTLVNGAGLAMNTLDALRSRGSSSGDGGGAKPVRAANFLDTGGKATAATVKASFDLILRDPRVQVIFVNIFGGLTDGGMIAEGILLAFKEVDMRGVPVIVRIRGTNEEQGQRIIAESGLGLEAFDQFEEAAARVIEIARERLR